MKLWGSKKNGCIHLQQDRYELSFRCILRYCPHPPLVFPLIICIYDSLYLAISCNYKCVSHRYGSQSTSLFEAKNYIFPLKIQGYFFQSVEFLSHSPMGKCKSCVKIESERSWVSN